MLQFSLSRFQSCEKNKFAVNYTVINDYLTSGEEKYEIYIICHTVL